MTAISFIDLPESEFFSQWPSLPLEEQLADPRSAECSARYDRLSRHIDQSIDRATREQAKKTTRTKEQHGLPWTWLEKIDVDLADDYLIKGLIWRRGHFILVYGPSGDGKTFFVIDAVMHIALGIPWRGRRVHRGLVVYIAAEAGASIFRRFIACRERYQSDAQEGLVPLAIVTKGVNLLNLVDVEGLIDELNVISTEAGMPVALVIFDTLSRSIPGGDENAAVDMTKVVEAADRIRDVLGASTVAIHHSGKDSARGARGHSSLFAAADTVVSVIDRAAVVEKVRDGITGDTFAFTLDVVHLGVDQDGEPITTCVVVPTDASAIPARREPVLSGVASVALQALCEAVDEHGTISGGSSTIPAGARIVKLDAWRARFALRYGEEDGAQRDGEAVRKAFQRGREALLKVDAIGISNPFAWATRGRP